MTPSKFLNLENQWTSPLSASLKMWVICGSVAGLRECQKWSESPKGHCRCCWPRQGWERRTMRQLFTATLRGLAFYEGGVGLVEDGVIEGGRATWYGVQIVVLGFPIIFHKETDSEFSSSPMFSEGVSDCPKTGHGHGGFGLLMWDFKLLRPLVPSPSCWWPQVVHQPFRQR